MRSSPTRPAARDRRRCRRRAHQHKGSQDLCGGGEDREARHRRHRNRPLGGPKDPSSPFTCLSTSVWIVTLSVDRITNRVNTYFETDPNENLVELIMLIENRRLTLVRSGCVWDRDRGLRSGPRSGAAIGHAGRSATPEPLGTGARVRSARAHENALPPRRARGEGGGTGRRGGGQSSW